MFFSRQKEIPDWVNVIRSDRKTISLEIKRDLSVILRVPNGMEDRDIISFLEQKQTWISENIEKLKKRLENEKNIDKMKKLTDDDLNKLKKSARKDLTMRAEYFSKIMGVEYKRIAIRVQKTLWGSCSGKNNLNFNCLLMLCPEKVRDYVVVHELCHLKEMNHSTAFWILVEKYCPDYKTHRLWLKNEGKYVMARMYK